MREKKIGSNAIRVNGIAYIAAKTARNERKKQWNAISVLVRMRFILASSINFCHIL